MAGNKPFEKERREMNKRGVKIKMLILGMISLSVFSCTRQTRVPLDLNYPTKPMELPRDLAAHDWAQMEWWYYTGHVQGADGKNYAFELTFFKHRTDLDRFQGMAFGHSVPLVYMAHFSVVDEDTGEYLHEALALSAGKEADAKSDRYQVNLGPWSAGGDDQIQRLSAKTDRMAVSFEVRPLKPAVMHGDRGIVPKGDGLANYYMSYTRLAVSGELTFEGKKMPVTGLAWFDHEFGYMGVTPDTGWDWFSIQLDDNTEYMIYVIKRADRGIEPLSRACRIDQQSREQCILINETEISRLGVWKSPHTRTTYPSGWRIKIPKWNLDLIVAPEAADQEFIFMDLGYWEGGCKAIGKPASGLAFIELVGYGNSRVMGVINPDNQPKK